MPLCPQCKQASPQSSGCCPNCAKGPDYTPPLNVSAENELTIAPRGDPETLPTPTKDEKIFATFGAPLHTIGGWLLLPLLGLGKYAFSAITSLINIKENYLTARAEYAEAGNTGWVLFADFNIIAEVGLLALCFYVFYLFAKRKKSTPKMYVLFILSQLFLVVVNSIWLSRLAPAGVSMVDIAWEAGIVPIAISVLVWGLYFRFSKRVKNVFVS